MNPAKWHRVFWATLFAIALSASLAHALTGDLDGDGDVDREDVTIIFEARNTPAIGPNDPRDLDGDGRITLLDARKLVLLCTRPRCATEPDDTTPPVVAITAPPDQSLSNTSPITVTGSVDDDTATVTVNGVPATVSAGTFTAAGVPLQQGANTLTATATDPAGNVGTKSIQVTLDTTPTQVSIASPSDGATLNTNTPQIRIAYADPMGAGVDLNSLVVEINGVDRTGLFTKGATEATAQLTNATALTEGSNTIQARINDRAGNAASATSTVTVITQQVIPAGFGVVLGQVIDASTNQPLAGTTVKALGTTSEVLTDNQGRFELPAPPGDRVAVYFNKGTYIDAKVFAVVEQGRESSVGTIGLQPFDQVATRIDSNGGSHTDSTGTVQVIFPAGAVGTAIDVTATVFPTADEFPLKVPEGQAYLAGVQFTPENLTFAQPVTVRIANTLNLPPGTDVPFAFANHGDQNPDVTFFDAGMARVSANGQFLEAQLPHFSCIALVLPVLTERPPVLQELGDAPVESSPQKCCAQVGSRVGAQDGTLFLDQVLPPTRTLGRANSLTLTYSSATADPHPLIRTEALLDPLATTLPQQVRWQLRVGPLQEERIFTPQAGASRYAFSWDPRDSSGNLLPTGSYRVDVTLSNDYQGTLATTTAFGGPPVQDLGIPVPGLTPQSVRPNARVVINNQQQSPFGAGWGLQGLQRLHPQPDGVVITDGGGTALTFRTTTPLLYATVGPGTTTFGAVSALDPETGDIQFVFPTILAANVVRAAPAGETIFVGTPEQGVLVINGRTQEILGSVGIPLVQDLAVSPDRATLVVVAGNPSFFAIVDVPTRQRVFALPLSGSGGSGVALSPDGRLAYAAQQATDDVAVIDTQTRSLVATIPLGGQPTVRTMVLSADGKTLFVGVGAGVAVIDTTTNSLQTTVSLTRPGFGLALTPAGRLFVTSRTPTVTVIDTSTLQVTGTVTLPLNSADGITVSPDGQRVLVTASEPVGARQFRSFVVVLDAGTGAFLEQFPLPDGVAGSVAFLVGDPNQPLAPPGDFSTLTRNDQGTPQEPSDDTWLRRMKDGTEHIFSASGLHLETRDRNGNRTVFGYDAADRLVSITDPVGGVTSLSYIGGKLTSVTDPGGRTTQFSTDGAEDLVAVTTPDGATTQYSYDGRHRVIAKTDPRGAVTQYQYDGFGRLSRAIHPTGEERTITPSDAQGLLNNVPAGTPAPPIPATTLFAQLTDGLNRTTQIATDPLGAATETVDALGRTTAVTRNVNGLPLEITRPDGAVITLTYDPVGNLLSTVQRGPFIGSLQTFFTYEPVFNQVTSITDPSGNTTAISYDANSNPTQITDALGNATTLTYDTRGLLSSVTDALGNVTTFTYDATGNLISTTDPRGNTTSLSYDAAGNVVTSTDALGRTTQFAYDAMNRLTQVTDAAGGITQYTYDPNGNLTSVSDANGQTTTFTYDQVNQLLQTTNPLGQAKTFAYDLARNLVSTTDAQGQTISFTYDAANQLLQKALPTGEVVTFNYDVLGNLTLAQDADSELTFAYDALGRVIRADTPATAAQPASTLTHSYDKNGNRRNTNFASAGAGVGFSLLYAHDALNRLTNLTPLGVFNPVTFTYDALSRRTSMTLSNGALANYTYDAASQLTSLVHDQAGSPIASFNYTYDAVGNRTSLTDLDGVNDYVYDGLNRLAQATHPQPTNPAEDFTYDPVGNRTSSHLATGQVHDLANRLLDDANFTYTYDANGNLVEKRSKATGDLTQYTYDPENQLIRVEQFTVVGGSAPVMVADYHYDALGRRIEKVVNGVSTRFVYDNEDIILEVDGTGRSQAITLHGPGIDEPLAVIRRTEAGFKRFTYHADGLGSISTLTDLNGTPVRSYTYDSFGQIVDETGTVTDPYTYTGREFDPETGLLYYRARYYDPTIGRFLQQDPFKGMLQVPLSFNPYPYVLDNPARFTDPTGKVAPLLLVGLFAAVGAGTSFYATYLTGGTIEEANISAGIGAVVGGASGGVGVGLTKAGVQLASKVLAQSIIDSALASTGNFLNQLLTRRPESLNLNEISFTGVVSGISSAPINLVGGLIARTAGSPGARILGDLFVVSRVAFFSFSSQIFGPRLPPSDNPFRGLCQ